MMEVELKYEPRVQFMEFHQREQRFAALVCHRRAGKTVACVNELITRALYTGKKNARYAYVAPFFRQAKDVAWEYLKDFGGNSIVKIRESMLRVELVNGSWITLYGADNPDTLRGLYLDGIILDEAGDMRPSLWSDVILPTLIDRQGWAVFIGTPKGKNYFFDLFERAKTSVKWYCMMLKASESGILSAEDLEEMKEMQEADSYEQEFECSFEASVKGSYYNDLFREYDILGQAPYDPNYPVSVACDLGKSDSTAFWFWQITPDHGLRAIDYYEEDGKDLDHYFMMLDSKPYKYDTMWLPHDAKADTLAAKNSTAIQFMDWVNDRWTVNVLPRLAKQHGIDASRKVLKVITIAEEPCLKGINALRHYKRRYNDKLKAFSETPQHDWSSNGADAFRYMSIVVEDEIEAVDDFVSGIPQSETYCLEDLWKEQDSGNWRANTLRI